jgi:hypothetical protein
MTMKQLNRRKISIAVALLVVVMTSGAAFGQGVFEKYKDRYSKKDAPTRTVKGIVTDEAEVGLRAVVQLKNMRTLDVKSFHTDDAGSYYFYGLDLNIDYEIRAYADGYEAKVRKMSSFDDRIELFYAFELKKE